MVVAKVQGPLPVRKRQRPFGGHSNLKIGRGPGAVVDVQGQDAFIPRREKAGLGELGHHRRGHGHLPVGGAEPFRVEGHRHQTDLPVEVRQFQGDRRFAVFVKRNGPLEQGKQLHPGFRPFAAGEVGVAAVAQCRHAAVPVFDDPAVDVVGVDGKPPPFEKVAEGVRRLEVGDVENAHVHRRQGDVDRFRIGGGRTRRFGRFFQPEGHRQRAVGTNLLFRFQFNSELSVGPVQRQMDEPHGTVGRDFLLGVGRTKHHGADVDVVGVPTGQNGNLHLGALRRDGNAAGPERLVSLHGDDRFAGMGRRHRQFDDVAGPVARPVQRQRHPIRSGGVLPPGGPPAHLEPKARGQIGFRIVELEQVMAPLQMEPVGFPFPAHGQHVGAVGIGFLGVFVLPSAGFGVFPVVVPLFFDQGGLQFGGRSGRAAGADPDQFEADRAGLHRFGIEQRPDSHQRVPGPNRFRRRPGHGPSAGFEQIHRHLDGQRAPDRLPPAFHENLGLAGIVQFALLQIPVVPIALVGLAAEPKSGPVVEGLPHRPDVDPAGDPIAGGGRAVEIIALHQNPEIVLGTGPFRFGGQMELHPLRKEVLHLDVVPGDGGRGRRIGPDPKLPAAGGRVRRKGNLGLVIARPGLFRPPGEGPGLPAVGADQLGGQRNRFHRSSVMVPQQAGHRGGFAGSIEIARAVEKQLPGAVGPVSQFKFAQIQRRQGKGQNGHRIAGTGGDQADLAGEGAGKSEGALLVGSSGVDLFAFGPQKGQRDAGEGFAGFQGAGENQRFVFVGAGVETDVGDHEIGAGIIVAEFPGLTEDGQIHPGLRKGRDFLDRDVADGPAVGRRVQVEPAGKDHLAEVSGPGQLVVVGLSGGVAPPDVGEQALQPHAVELGVDAVHVDRHQRQPFAFPGRQHEAVAGEADDRPHLPGFHRGADPFPQGGAVGGGQGFQNGDAVLGFRLHVGKVEGPAVVGDHPGAFEQPPGVADPDVAVVSDRRVQRFGNHHRRGRAVLVGPLSDVQHSEFVRGACILLSGGRGRSGNGKGSEQKQGKGEGRDPAIHGGLPAENPVGRGDEGTRF